MTTQEEIKDMEQTERRMEISDITKEDIEDYERVRKYGKTNMWDTTTVCELSKGLTKEKCVLIMKNYDSLLEKFGVVR